VSTAKDKPDQNVSQLRQGEVGLVDRRPQPGTAWNPLTPHDEEVILREA
jgi:hypothetical protein